MTIDSMNRRQVLAGLAAGAGLTLLGTSRPAFAAASELVWATWDSNSRPEYVTAFEAKTGATVKLSYLSSDDAQFAALKTGSASDWDIVNPSINGAWRYIKANVLKPLDLAKIPNLSSLYDVFKTTDRVKGEDGATYAIPYLWGLNPIVYRTDVYAEEPTYSTLFDPKYKGQLAMRDYALESIAIAALHLGIDKSKVFTLSADELAEAKKVLIAQKPLLRTYWQTIGDLTNLFATGEVTAAFSWRVP
jgi:spermidine/putrescine transport system substrate-binding protein